MSQAGIFKKSGFPELPAVEKTGLSDMNITNWTSSD